MDYQAGRWIWGYTATPLSGTGSGNANGAASVSISSLSPVNCVLCRHLVTTYDTHLNGPLIGPFVDGRERYHVHQYCIASAADVRMITVWNEGKEKGKHEPTYKWFNVVEAITRARHIKVGTEAWTRRGTSKQNHVARIACVYADLYIVDDAHEQDVGMYHMMCRYCVSCSLLYIHVHVHIHMG